MIYRISNLAGHDLENIWLYTCEKWSRDQANRYYNLILDEIEYLAKNPYSGTGIPDIRKGYFRSRVNVHFIFYKINSKKQEV
jgi:toxin ParE1/3/4